MPQTQRNTLYSNKLKPAPALDSSLYGQGLGTKKSPSINNTPSIYGIKVNHTTKEGKDDFKQKLLEIRLNDMAAKYCLEKNIPQVGISVTKVKVTGAKTAEGSFVPLFANDVLVEKHLQPTKFYMRSGNLPSQIEVFIFEADASKIPSEAADYQIWLDNEYNNTAKIEKALRHELWHHTLIERCHEKGLTLADLATLDIIHIMQVHDAFIKSALAEELIEQRAEYLEKIDLDLIDDKFALYKKSLRDKIIKPDSLEISGSELAIIADCVQDLFNARADDDYMQGRVQTFVLCRKGTFASNKKANQVFDDFMRVCAEHDLNGNKVNLMFRQSKENFISQSTIDLLKRLDKSLFAKRDEDAVAAYFHYDKEDLQKTLNELKSSILKFYKDKEYLR